jgi:hypothetical protein
VWWFTSVTPALGKPKEEDRKFEASLGYIERFYLQIQIIK